MVPVEQGDGLPATVAEPLVDACGLRGHLGDEPLVPVDARSAGGRDLHEGDAPLEPRTLVEEALEPVETLEDALRVVHPIDADYEPRRLEAQLLAESGVVGAG